MVNAVMVLSLQPSEAAKNCVCRRIALAKATRVRLLTQIDRWKAPLCRRARKCRCLRPTRCAR